MQGWFRVLLLVFFVTHIPISIFIDAQVVFPREWFPQFARDLFDFHTTTNKDFLFRDCRTEYPYVRWIGVCEVFFQLPFFFFAVYGLLNKKEWLRIPAIVYCTHVPTTVIPAVADFLQNPKAPPFEDGIKLSLLYGIYFIIPTLWLIQLVLYPTVFSPQSIAPTKIRTN